MEGRRGRGGTRTECDNVEDEATSEVSEGISIDLKERVTACGGKKSVKAAGRSLSSRIVHRSILSFDRYVTLGPCDYFVR